MGWKIPMVAILIRSAPVTRLTRFFLCVCNIYPAEDEFIRYSDFGFFEDFQQTKKADRKKTELNNTILFCIGNALPIIGSFFKPLLDYNPPIENLLNCPLKAL